MTQPNQNFREEFSGRTFQQGRRSVLKSSVITTCIGLALVLAVLPARADEYDDGLTRPVGLHGKWPHAALQDLTRGTPLPASRALPGTICSATQARLKRE